MKCIGKEARHLFYALHSRRLYSVVNTISVHVNDPLCARGNVNVPLPHGNAYDVFYVERNKGMIFQKMQHRRGL